MTNTEAIKCLENIKKEIEKYAFTTALDMAIESLKRDEIGLTDTVKQIHDGVYAEAERKTIEKCVDMFSDIASSLKKFCVNSCPICCEWATHDECKDRWKAYLLEQLKEKE